MKKAIMIHVAKVAVAAGMLVAIFAGCCWDSGKNCCGKCCCDNGKCCATTCCEQKSCCEKKSSGMNTSMTVGLGTDGVHAGGAANVGSHGVSGGAEGSMH